MDYRIQRLKEDLTNVQQRNKRQRKQLANYTKKYNKLNLEKQQLISFLEDKIKENQKIQKYLYEKENIKLVEKAKINSCIGVYQEVLDFVNKRGKND